MDYEFMEVDGWNEWIKDAVTGEYRLQWVTAEEAFQQQQQLFQFDRDRKRSYALFRSDLHNKRDGAPQIRPSPRLSGLFLAPGLPAPSRERQRYAARGKWPSTPIPIFPPRKLPNLARVVPPTPEQRQEIQENVSRGFESRRRLVTIVTSLYTIAALVATAVWGFFTSEPTSEPTRIVAVETDASGRKRRAIQSMPGSWPQSPSPPLQAPSKARAAEVQSVSKEQMAEFHAAVPGSFPVEGISPGQPSNHQLITPPDTRPNSSQDNVEVPDSPADGQETQDPVTGQPSAMTASPETAPSAVAPPAPANSTTSGGWVSRLRAAWFPGRASATNTTEASGVSTPDVDPVAPSVESDSEATDTAPAPTVESLFAKLNKPATASGKLPVLTIGSAAASMKGKSQAIGRLPPPTVGTRPASFHSTYRANTKRLITKPAYSSQRCQNKTTENKEKDEAVDGMVRKVRVSILSPSHAPKESIRVRKMHELSWQELEQIRINRELNEDEEYYIAKDQRALARWRARIAAKQKELDQAAAEADLRAQKDAREAAKAAAVKAQVERDTKRLAEEKRVAEEKIRLDSNWIKKQSLVRALDTEWDQKISQIMEVKSKESVVATTVDGVDLKRGDIGSLVSTTGSHNPWLNDEIVNGIISAIVSRKLEKTGHVKGTVPAFASMATMWYTNVKKKGIKSIETWTRRKGIKGKKLLGCQKVFFPVNTGVHWMLLIISPQARTIEFLDSLASLATKKEMFRLAHEWLEMELGKDYDASEWKELEESVSVQQTNSDDCGVFTCFNALAAAKGRAYEEVGHGSMQDARRTLAAVLVNGGFKNDFEL